MAITLQSLLHLDIGTTQFSSSRHPAQHCNKNLYNIFNKIEVSRLDSRLSSFIIISSYTLTLSESIVNHPKYAHLFRSIGRFKCNPVHIMTKQNGVPIQKPQRKVPVVMREQFKKEQDSMEDQGIISKFDGRDISPKWLNSFVIVKNPMVLLEFALI